ncbi:MAG: carbamate kinase [Candidatus Thermoplasmatota archaeon]|nr:carbamate kinase [Candidatus Thermoplasmatota archaeon]MBS3802251.1 carbamate kinase [Candidatus Thermoplasmatota archaeon]
MGKKIIIALGGNALIKKGQTGTIHEQFSNTRDFSKQIVTMIQHGWTPVITHGNGPQVGAILLQNNATRDTIPPMPLGVCVAESEGLIGYMIQQCLKNALTKADISNHVATIITQVLVDKNDESFSNPTKPIGPYYPEDQIDQLKEDGYNVTKLPKGYRIVVPSPDPLAIIEAPVIKLMLEQDITVIAAGGGGMPVIQKKEWGLDGVEAVVDKDLASERLAESINAKTMLILTNVEHVYVGFNTKQKQKIEKISLKEIKKLYENDEFPPGSMGPKILAAIRFLESGGKNVIISHVDSAWDALSGKTGTHILKTL